MSKIVICDDSRTERDTAWTSANIAFPEMEILCFEDGIDILDAIKKDAFPDPSEVALVITDLSMPILDGDRLFDEMRDKGYGCPFVLVSGTILNQEAKDYWVKYGFAAASHKPYSPTTMAETIRSLVVGNEEPKNVNAS